MVTYLGLPDLDFWPPGWLCSYLDCFSAKETKMSDVMAGNLYVLGVTLLFVVIGLVMLSGKNSPIAEPKKRKHKGGL